MTTLLLASGSPRRRELLSGAGVEIVVKPVELDETPHAIERPEHLAKRLAEEKARSAWARATEPGLVLGADTIVVADGEILGKPANRDQAISMLSGLRAGQHQVITGVALLDMSQGRIAADVEISHVPMRDYSEVEIAKYVDGGSPLDKAGAYGIQDAGFQPVAKERFQDCYTNVMGLPLCRLEKLFHDLGLHCPVDLVAACFSFGRHRLTW